MKTYFAILCCALAFAGCGSSENNDPQKPAGVSQPVTPAPAINENLRIAVGFESGSYTYVVTRYLKKHGNLFVAESSIEADPNTDYVRVWFPVPSIISAPDTTLMRVRYGCSGRSGDIYFMEGAMSEVASQVANGKTIFAATVNELEAVFSVCRNVPVAISFELYDQDLTKVEAYVVVYLKAEHETDFEQEGD